MKKFVALLLAVLMMALPILGLAEDTSLVEEAIAAGRKATTTIRLNQLFNDEALVGKESAETISALLNALSLIITEQKDGGSLALIATSPAEEGAEPATSEISFAYGPTETGDSYLTSSLLGNQKLVVSDDEILPFAKKLVNAAQLLGMLDAETAAQVQAQIDAADLDEVKKQLESALAEAESISIDETAVNAFMETWKDAITVEPVEGQPKNCDHAVTVITIDMSPEMLKDYYRFCMQSVYHLPDEIMDASLEQIGNMSALVRAYIDSQGDVVYLTATGESIETTFVDKDGEEMDPETVELLKQYLTEEELVGRFEEVQTKMTSEVELTRLTRDHDVAYSLNVEVKQADKTIGTLTGSLVMEDNGHALAQLDMTIPSEDPEKMANSVSVNVDVQNYATETTDHTIVMVNVVPHVQGQEGTVVANATSVVVDVKTARTETTEDTAVNVDVVVTEETAEQKNEVKVNALCTVNAVKDGVDVTENASFVVTMDVQENGEEHHAKLLDITATTVTGEPDAPVPDAACVHPAMMTDNAFLGWIGDLMNSLQMNFMTFMQTLPEEVLAGMMG